MKLFAYSCQYADEYGAAMHLALQENDHVVALNHGFGVLFPKAEMNVGLDGCTKGLVKPWLFRTKCGRIGVAALRRDVNENGNAKPEADHAHEVLFFITQNLTEYVELPLVPAAKPGEVIEDVRCTLKDDAYVLQICVEGSWRTLISDQLKNFAVTEDQPIPESAKADLWDADGVCAFEITEAEAAHLRTRLIPPALPQDAPQFPFPFMPPRGDPMAIHWGNGYLFMATDDERDQRALKIRYSDTLAGIAQAEDHVIFRANEDGDYSGCLWAPELHWVGGRLCIFFAAGMPHWYTVQSRVMFLVGEDPLDANSWSEPRRMERVDGGHLTDEGITLDMTVVPSGGADYVIWSQRPMYDVTEQVKCGTADLVIARLNTAEPWRLASEPVVLCRPEYGWERIHSPVCEGPFLLKHGNTLYVTYAAALIDHTYAVGVLWADDGADLTDLSVWTKCNYPVLHRLSVPHQLGAGHNAFVQDEKGNDILLIHALDMRNYLQNPRDGRRYPCLRMIMWDDEGFPHLDTV